MGIPLGYGKPGETVEIQGIVLEFEAPRAADSEIGLDSVF
jgi:hypothetical protein